jgi:hypothetical protein
MKPLQIIRHRVNSVRDLKLVPNSYGTEIDLRTKGRDIILTHDVFSDGDTFENYASRYAAQHMKGPLILNTKEDGLEGRLIQTVKKMGIRNYFFLDLSLPTLVRLAVKEKNKNIAIRVSEYESPLLASRFKGLVDWVWVDTFSGKPAPVSWIRKLRKDFRVCLVSPELQGYSVDTIKKFRVLIPEATAVCTKVPALWK